MGLLTQRPLEVGVSGVTGQLRRTAQPPADPRRVVSDVWGAAVDWRVNLASRMESGGVPDSIQVTRPVYEKLKDEFVFEPRGTVEVKGKGGVEAWLLKL